MVLYLEEIELLITWMKKMRKKKDNKPKPKVGLVTMSLGDLSKLTEEQLFWLELSPKEKREIEHLKMDLLQSGFGKDSDFVAKACHEEAIRIFKEKNGNKN